MKPPRRGKAKSKCTCCSGKQPTKNKKVAEKRPRNSSRKQANTESLPFNVTTSLVETPNNDAPTTNNSQTFATNLSVPSTSSSTNQFIPNSVNTQQLPIHMQDTDMSDDTSSDSDQDETDAGIQVLPSFQEAVAQHSQNITSGNGIQFAEPISTPIINQVRKSLCKDIWKNKYVDMATLLPSSQNLQPVQYTLQMDSNSQFTINPTSRTRKISNIESWTTAFIRFMAVYLVKYPLESQQLLKYMEIVRDLARRRPGLAFLYYDTQFRLLRESIIIPWDRIHTEFWLMACTSLQQPQQSFRSNHQPTRNNNFNSSRRFLEKTCWNFNKRSQCHNQKCTQPHICGFCRGAHAAYNCKFTSKEQAAKVLSQPSNSSRPAK